MRTKLPTWDCLAALSCLVGMLTPAAIAATNLPPVVNLTWPTNGAVFTSPASINIQANASDPDGTITRVDFYNGAVKVGDHKTVPYYRLWSNVPPGQYTLVAIAYDNLDTAATPSRTTSAPVTITVVAPVTNNATYQLTVAGGTGSGSYAAGTVVNISASQPPAGQVFLQWTGAAVASPTSPSTTLKMPTAPTVVTAQTQSNTIVPQPVSSHPRLWVNTGDLPRLRSWANSTNPMYVNGFKPALTSAISTYNTKFFPNGQPNPVWPDGGSSNYELYDTEMYAEFFAFASLIDQDPVVRDQHAQRARNLLMYAINEAAKGVATSTNGVEVPFRSPIFATYNRAGWWGEAWGLTVDWIYPYLSAQDKATIRSVFLRWSDDCLHAATAGNEHPQPIGVMNDPQLLANTAQLRWSANNYYTTHARNLTLMALSLDAVDDPQNNAWLGSKVLGNTLRSYIQNVTGAWLYQQYAVYEPASVAAQAYGVSTNGLGVASGGLSPEGFLYGASMGDLAEELLALKTAGFDDPALSGPQIGLIHSPLWNKYFDGFLHSIAPQGYNPSNPAYNYLGQLWQMANYGDILREWIGPDYFNTFGILGLLGQQNNQPAYGDQARWVGVNVVEGGPSKLYQRASNIWGNCYATQSILYFLLFDPALAAPVDPRPAMATSFYDPALGRFLGRTDWTTNASWLSWICRWTTLDHQNGDGNQFEFYRKGEWLTKERSGYDIDGVAMTPDYHNTLSLQNDVPANVLWFEDAIVQRGGQWTEGLASGDPTATVSTGPGYVFTQGDATKLYGRWDYWNPQNRAMDITQAVRSLVWLQPDHVVIYDRATSKTSGRFKRFNMTLCATPVVDAQNRTATVTTSRQQFFVQSLLPAAGVMTVSQAENFNLVADLDPTRQRLVIEDPSGPADTRFLTVLQGADLGVPATTAVVVESVSGVPFEGAQIGNTAVLFPINIIQPGAPFAGTSYAVPVAAKWHVITGLAPSGGYDVTVGTDGVTNTVTVVPGSAYQADSAGVLSVSTP
ncbi:MAG TPA: Ig-like domain-containing protein [Candidatus Limnocylindria bacterium]|nr:Ig-like domain-containing protein [Candidatus Limnocylindria bacterium]